MASLLSLPGNRIKSPRIMNHMHFNKHSSYMLNMTRKRILNVTQKFTGIFLWFYYFKYDILNMFLEA